MTTPATRQDLQNALDRTKSSIMSSMLSRGDLQTVISAVRMGILQDMHGLHSENKASIRQAINHRDQITQRLAGLEQSLGRIEQLLSHIVTQQSRTSTRMESMKPDGAYLFQRI